MTTTVETTTFVKKESITRRIVMGLVFAAFGLIVFLIFLPQSQSGAITTFVMTPGGITRGVVGNWLVQSRISLTIVGVLISVAAVFQLVRGFKRYTNPILGVVVLLWEGNLHFVQLGDVGVVPDRASLRGQ
mgnify:CR=1 FL=1